MRILQVVTLFTPDGAFGGPTRVALNQVRELRARGHEVELVGAADGYGAAIPREVDGVEVRLFPARRLLPLTGFAGLASPGLLAWLRRSLQRFDVVHVHLARDLVTLPVAALCFRAGRPYVAQTHGMVDAPSNLLARVLDCIVTRRVLRGAGAILCLTEAERADVQAVGGPALSPQIVPNGVPFSGLSVHWTAASAPEVLFLARLQARKRPNVFVQAALELSADFPDADFRLVGPDEGEAASVQTLLQQSPQSKRIHWEGAIDPSLTLERMASCTVYVLPSVHEPFPMSVLEAMSVAKPVVITDSCQLASFITTTGSGIVTDGSCASLVEALRLLLGDPAAAADMGRRGQEAVRNSYSLPSVVSRLESLYGGPVHA